MSRTGEGWTLSYKAHTALNQLGSEPGVTPGESDFVGTKERKGKEGGREKEMCRTQPNSLQLGLGIDWQESFNNENPPQLEPGTGLEVVPTRLGLPPLRRPYLLPEPVETNLFSFPHCPMDQPSVFHPSVGSGYVDEDGTRRAIQGPEPQGLSPQNSTTENQTRELGLRDIYVGLGSL